MKQDECPHIRRTLTLATRFGMGADNQSPGWGQHIIASCIQCGHIMEKDEIVEVLSREATVSITRVELDERLHKLKKKLVKEAIDKANNKIQDILRREEYDSEMIKIGGIYTPIFRFNNKEKKSWIEKVLSKVSRLFRSSE